LDPTGSLTQYSVKIKKQIAINLTLSVFKIQTCNYTIFLFSCFSDSAGNMHTNSLSSFTSSTFINCFTWSNDPITAYRLYKHIVYRIGLTEVKKLTRHSPPTQILDTPQDVPSTTVPFSTSCCSVREHTNLQGSLMLMDGTEVLSTFWHCSALKSVLSGGQLCTTQSKYHIHLPQLPVNSSWRSPTVQPLFKSNYCLLK